MSLSLQSFFLVLRVERGGFESPLSGFLGSIRGVHGGLLALQRLGQARQLLVFAGQLLSLGVLILGQVLGGGLEKKKIMIIMIVKTLKFRRRSRS